MYIYIFSAGGYLCRPAMKYDLFKGSEFFEKYPYCLPCLFCSIFTIFAAIVAAFVMVETRVPRSNRGKTSGGRNSVNSSQSYAKVIVTPSSNPNPNPISIFY